MRQFNHEAAFFFFYICFYCFFIFRTDPTLVLLSLAYLFDRWLNRQPVVPGKEKFLVFIIRLMTIWIYGYYGYNVFIIACVYKISFLHSFFFILSFSSQCLCFMIFFLILGGLLFPFPFFLFVFLCFFLLRRGVLWCCLLL